MEAQHFDEVRNVLFDDQEGRRFKIIRSTEPESPDGVVITTENAEGQVVKEILPHAHVEINDNETESRFVIRVLQRSRDAVSDHHTAAIVFTTTAVITGVATGIITYRKRR